METKKTALDIAKASLALKDQRMVECSREELALIVSWIKGDITTAQALVGARTIKPSLKNNTFNQWAATRLLAAFRQGWLVVK